MKRSIVMILLLGLTVKYVVNALAPENYLTYQADKTYRIAQWAGQ